jgi:hypothetical protein
MSALVQVDAASRVAVGKVPLHGALKDVIIVGVGRLGDIRVRQAEHIAELSEEERVIGALLPALLTLPLRNKGFDWVAFVVRGLRVH